MKRLLLLLWVLSSGVRVLGAAELPNILMIAIDDQNDWIGCLGGHPQARTPSIDALASRGTVFTNAHCQSPLCNPSRTSLMTGLRPGTTGVYGLAPWFRTLPEFSGLLTLPQYFARHGNYHTAMTGKIYHGRSGRSVEGRFVEWHEVGPGASGKPFPPKQLINTPQPHRLVDWGTFPHQDGDKGDYQVASWAVDRLKAYANPGNRFPILPSLPPRFPTSLSTSFSGSLNPAVSTRVMGTPSIIISASKRSLVVPGSLFTIARLEPTSALKSVDLPEFGGPHNTTTAPEVMMRHVL